MFQTYTMFVGHLGDIYGYSAGVTGALTPNNYEGTTLERLMLDLDPFNIFFELKFRKSGGGRIDNHTSFAIWVPDGGPWVQFEYSELTAEYVANDEAFKNYILSNIGNNIEIRIFGQ